MRKTSSLLTVGLVAVGFVLAGPLGASATETNHTEFWQTVSGETCAKYEPVVTPYTLPAPEDGRTYSKVVIKAGSSGHGGVVDENTVYTTNLLAGLTFTHLSGKNVSHVILCTVPVPVVVVDVCTNIVGVQTVIPGGMEAGPAVVGGPTCVPVDEACPGETCGVTPPVEPEVPVDEPTVPEVPVTPVTDELARTGFDSTPYLFGGLGLLLAGAGFMVFRHQGLVLR